MISSKIKKNDEAYVWIWLPQQTEPVVAGRVKKADQLHVFTYGRSYLENREAISLSPFELPLKAGNILPEGINTLHSCLRDSGPDAWGRRIIDHQYANLKSEELDYLLLSGRDRIGALDFQSSSSEYCAREPARADLEDLLKAASYVEQNKPLPADLEYALLRGTSVGGARPKALIYG